MVRWSLMGWVVLVSMAGLLAGCGSRLAPMAAPRNGVVRPGPGQSDPLVVSGIAAGDYSLRDGREAHYGCVGLVTREPSFVLELSVNVPFLRVFTDSHQDTTLAIRTPDGRYLCDDNSYGWNASVEGQFRSGVYAIWVGTKHSDLNPAYQLAFTTRQDLTSLSQQ